MSERKFFGEAVGFVHDSLSPLPEVRRSTVCMKCVEGGLRSIRKRHNPSRQKISSANEERIGRNYCALSDIVCDIEKKWADREAGHLPPTIESLGESNLRDDIFDDVSIMIGDGWATE